ncbi:ring-cleaving dioxygenase [Halobacillus shinanisalinarum]|uniref:Ring-cleaving dioxygenase n=1 Tax=Halobacillus shinanisalinarum TaxID=2932258 RepID=A0ABY4H8E0_9BACI|nr:ring-cleaving dioxygenase [Halobacillus shinanisalinarum]UOQ95242.1 ring-cleaving dioxygenase [Halobacillus shinanisalinarum]
MNIKGIHHVSAITANAKQNYDFYTNVLGMRLVKKTVNQDDNSMYHLFYADEKGNPGTDLTFFEIPRAGTTYPGTHSISTTSLRVQDDKALEYWKDRFDAFGVDQDPIKETMSRKTLAFRDPEGQRLTLVSDENNEGVTAGTAWDKSIIPQEKGINGLGPVHLTVADAAPTAKVLTEILGFRKVGTFDDRIVFEAGEGGTGAEVHIEANPELHRERPGRGSVHHVAFRVEDEAELAKWKDKIQGAGYPNSGLVDRFYFKSLYFREPNHILFELATDGPGFATDEDEKHLGESLALPPFLEHKREQIETNLTPLETNK